MKSIGTDYDLNTQSFSNLLCDKCYLLSISLNSIEDWILNKFSLTQLCQIIYCSSLTFVERTILIVFY